MNRPPISREFAERFAEEWIAAWNAHDLPRILSHYEDDFEMASPLIVEIAGEPSGVLRGKEKIGAYWEKALRLSPDLQFERLGVFPGVRSLAIHFRNQNGRLSVETFEIGESGRVIWAAAHHALPVGSGSRTRGDDHMVPETLDAWTHDAIRNVVKQGVFESRLFDFKETVPSGADDGGKLRLRKTLAAFANTTKRPTARDREARRVESSCRCQYCLDGVLRGVEEEGRGSPKPS
jgi:hypothetical protein